MRLQAARSGFLALCVSSVVCQAVGASTTFSVSSMGNLVQIESGEGHYALWALVHGDYRFVGEFNTDTDTQHMRDVHTGQRFSSFLVPEDWSTANVMLVTVEHPDSPNQTPSTHRMMAGDVVTSSAVLNPDHSQGLGLDYAWVSGSFVLDTPTTSSSSDFASGVWFLSPGSPDGPAFDLPELPAGWVYESWVSDAGSVDAVPISMGEFRDPDGPDADGAGGGAGVLAAPRFPGQDFINPYLDQPIMPNLTKGFWTLVISIEPDPNTGPSPFHSLEPLICTGISTLSRRQPQTLLNNENQFPYTTVTISTTTDTGQVSWGAIKSLFTR